jgi:hypothetical protein
MSIAQDTVAVVSAKSLKALVICEPGLSPQDRHLTRMLGFFGIPWTAVTSKEIGGAEALPADLDGKEFCILSSAACMAEALQRSGGFQDELPSWLLRANSVYIYAFTDTDPCRNLLRWITNDREAKFGHLRTTEASLSVSSCVPHLSGPMSGIRVSVTVPDDLAFDIAERANELQAIIRANDLPVFLEVRRGGLHFYLNACRRLVDIDSSAPKSCDVKKLFCEAVPIVMYVKWAFRGICWTSPEMSCSLVVDDPPLERRYGFLHYREALELMDKHNFSTTIAFIPWNWRRTHSATVALFRQRPDRFSLCVHGCDHIAGEFGARSTRLLNRRIKTASERMGRLSSRTSLQFDRVMVFPQGVFSPESGRALKLNGYVAAANTEVAPSDHAENKTKIADVWDIAIMKYGDFPIFTRRYITHGVENCAFDALLGKPCLLVAHHNEFRDHGRDLLQFINNLNSLAWNHRWLPLGEAISRSFKIRPECNGTSLVQMSATRLLMENPTDRPREAVVLKQEADLDCVRAVMVNQTAIEFGHQDHTLQFEIKLEPKELADVRVIYSDQLDADPGLDGLGHAIKAWARRHFSELRDNYFARVYRAR